MRWHWHPLKWQLMGVGFALVFFRVIQDAWQSNRPLDAEIIFLILGFALAFFVGFLSAIIVSAVYSFRLSWRSKQIILR